MQVELFHNSPTGKLVAISGTSRQTGPWSHHAFLPDPLGAEGPELSGAVYRQVAESRAALAALDTTARGLPNARLFRHPTLRLEAQATAALEGTYEPLSEVLTSDPLDEQTPAMTEVLNYLTVAELAFEWNEEGRPWSVSTLGELHRLLMLGTAGERDYHGVRPIQVVIGRHDRAQPTDPPIKATRFVPPPPGAELHARLSDLLVWAQTDHRPAIDPVVATAMTHYTFEALHPFHDGNGRLGRLLIVLQLNLLGVLEESAMTVSPWFEAHRQRYYDALFGVSTKGDWSTWVGMFAEGLTWSADQTRRRMLELVEVHAGLRRQVQTSTIRSTNALHLVDFAVATPTFTVNRASEVLGMGYAGAKKVVDSLVALGVLEELGARDYNRRFHAPAALEVLLRG